MKRCSAMIILQALNIRRVRTLNWCARSLVMLSVKYAKMKPFIYETWTNYISYDCIFDKPFVYRSMQESNCVWCPSYWPPGGSGCALLHTLEICMKPVEGCIFRFYFGEGIPVMKVDVCEQFLCSILIKTAAASQWIGAVPSFETMH